MLSFALAIVSIGKKQLEIRGAEVCVPLLRNPVRFAEFKDWRLIMTKFDSHFLTEKEYSAAFKAAGVQEFP
jgi:hypothetical protein